MKIDPLEIKQLFDANKKEYSDIEIIYADIINFAYVQLKIAASLGKRVFFINDLDLDKFIYKETIDQKKKKFINKIFKKDDEVYIGIKTNWAHVMISEIFKFHGIPVTMSVGLYMVPIDCIGMKSPENNGVQ